MFTPPPSPQPPPPKRLSSLREEKQISDSDDDMILDIGRDDRNGLVANIMAGMDMQQKKRLGRRTQWAILLVPVVLILVTLSSRSIASSRRNAFEFRDEPRMDWASHHTNHNHLAVAPHHKRVPQALTLSTTAGSGSSLSANPSGSNPAATTSIPQTAQTLPPAPTATASVTIPTPFPQPYDSVGATSNLTTQSCQNFFVNMTQSDDFRKCRPLSLLLQFGSAFIEAQSNITGLSNILFGTCNTPSDFNTCTSNLASFASQLSSSCSKEVSQGNSLVMQTRQGLLTYPITRNAGCLIDQTGVMSYCYVEAVHSSSPADLYLYQLPMGTPLPNKTTPSCSPCAGSVMGVYSSALQANGGNGSTDGLKASYDSAASLMAKKCGSGYVTVGVVGNAAGMRWDARGSAVMSTATTLFAVALAIGLSVL